MPEDIPGAVNFLLGGKRLLLHYAPQRGAVEVLAHNVKGLADGGDGAEIFCSNAHQLHNILALKLPPQISFLYSTCGSHPIVHSPASAPRCRAVTAHVVHAHPTVTHSGTSITSGRT